MAIMYDKNSWQSREHACLPEHQGLRISLFYEIAGQFWNQI
jgi:hypothetical protein